MRNILRTVVMCLFAPAAVSLAQENPLATHNEFLYGGVKKIVVRAAETMPEEDYAYKPTEKVRSFGQIVGHVADAQYTFCSAVLGEKKPAQKIENTKTSKADLVAALREAFAYCDRAYDSITADSAEQLIPFHGQDTPKLGVLTVNSVHTIEHYGNLVTYLRMNGFVPPTSDPEFMKQLMK